MSFIFFAAFIDRTTGNNSFFLQASVVSASLPNSSTKYESIISAILVDARLFRDYQQAAEVMAEAAVRDHWRIIVGCEEVQNCLAETIDKLALNLFHRPISPSERERYVSLFKDAYGQALYATGSRAEKGIHIILEAMLQSPHFIYRQDFDIAGGHVSEIP